MTDDIVARLRGYCDGNNDLMDAAADRIEQLEAALHEWDALIEHQYSGSQEAMSDMTYAAQRTAHLLHGDPPWPEPRRAALEGGGRPMTDDFIVDLKSYILMEHRFPREAWCDPDDVQAALDEIERLRAALQEIAWIATPDHEEARHKATEIARAALEGEKTND